jgi:hypothetical protein
MNDNRTSLVEKFIVKTLQASPTYLTEAHEKHLNQAEGLGETCTLIGPEELMVEFPSQDFGGVWSIDLTDQALNQAMAAPGWEDLVALIRLALNLKCDRLEMHSDYPTFGDEADAGYGLSFRNEKGG